jgi:cobalt-precorrin 5A hydrolase
MVAPHIQEKTSDPAVVVTDEKGRHVISLISGHLGGANALARDVADITGGRPVITTATDVNDLPAIDMLARKHGLAIENPGAIKHVNMAILDGTPVELHDPHGFLGNPPMESDVIQWRLKRDCRSFGGATAGVCIDDRREEVPDSILLLRPPTLAAGIGCNRGTGVEEIRGLLDTVLTDYGLARESLKTIASVDIKQDEAGLIRLAGALKLPLTFYTRKELRRVETIETPSAMVEKHLGVKSVCEAAAILATDGGRLIVTKKTTKNVTVAIARVVSLS